MESTTETRTVEAKCYCGGVHFNLDIPVADLPLKAYFCHCSICRYNTGTLANMHANLSQGVEPKWVAPSSSESLVSYHIDGVGYTPKSCSTCGCHIGAVGNDDGGWTLATAVLKEHGRDLVKITSHVFSKSAGDGGLSGILTHVQGKEIATWNPKDDQPSAAAPKSKPEAGADGQERLRAQCRCGGVSFTVPRPNRAMAEHAYAKHFVSPLDPNKWYGTLDVCDDCRLINGTPVASWIFVPLDTLEPTIGEDLRLGTLKTYVSSEGVTRAFCGVCSATVFFLQHSRRYNEVPVVDISTGLLRAPEGAMAERWITWRTRSSFEGDGLAFDKDMAEGIVEGMKKWTAERNGGHVLTGEI
ncbi:DUF636 domain protein [Cordyceps fumosorosea ARSEF 2679]|uniref:DUF636 domain protein n=1 Tax=Cordyceps fumosorosea (strain ARSEF 2679) TaxID=1081104 RepID=A0A168AM65_CORFA|nr:DUF636 domain protein [Cordyceps fumosorosea ARSEF 2679]OAA68933.1 DUF636 domain protein [Cordyceps fumosorosea ARSEF 2679]